MKIVLAGGTGQLGQVVAREFASRGAEVVVFGRGVAPAVGRFVRWDGRTLAGWKAELEGADVVLNLAGRSVNCRYSQANLRAMLDSRVESTRVIGQAIGAAQDPPRLWLQMSTATIYAHRFDAANDESDGVIGGSEPDAPAYWKKSIEIAEAWERELEQAATPRTRKLALRAAMVMSPDRDGIFDTLLALVRRGLGGPAGNGRQYVSWIHHQDFLGALDFLIEHEEFSGAINLAAPVPLPQREFMRALRSAWGTSIGLPASRWMLAIGAWFMRTDTELILKSRRVVPGRLDAAGFRFAYPEWPAAASELVAAWKAQDA